MEHPLLICLIFITTLSGTLCGLYLGLVLRHRIYMGKPGKKKAGKKNGSGSDRNENDPDPSMVKVAEDAVPEESLATKVLGKRTRRQIERSKRAPFCRIASGRGKDRPSWNIPPVLTEKTLKRN